MLNPSLVPESIGNKVGGTFELRNSICESSGQKRASDFVNLENNGLASVWKSNASNTDNAVLCPSLTC